MNNAELVNLITKKVVERLNTSATSSPTSNAACDCGGGGDVCHCDGGSCPTGWDGVGNPAAMLEAGAARLGAVGAIGSCPDRGLARMIDHTLLKPEATANEIEKLCKEAAENCFMSVCVNASWVPTAARLLRGTGVKVCTVVGFPLGATFTRVKELEARIAIDEGANEIDMVLNVGALLSGDLRLVESDIHGVVRACRGNIISKVILEVGYLSPEQIVIASKLAQKAGANFVKTSTGFGKGGATAESIRLMRETVGDTMGVKASGGVRDHTGALNMVAAGASRIGASASVAIINCDDAKGGGY